MAPARNPASRAPAPAAGEAPCARHPQTSPRPVRQALEAREQLRNACRVLCRGHLRLCCLRTSGILSPRGLLGAVSGDGDGAGGLDEREKRTEPPGREGLWRCARGRPAEQATAVTLCPPSRICDGVQFGAGIRFL